MAYISVHNSFSSNTTLNAVPMQVNFSDITQGLSQGNRDLNIRYAYASIQATSGIFTTINATSCIVSNVGSVRKELCNAESTPYYSYKQPKVTTLTATSATTNAYNGGFHDGKYGYLVPYFYLTTNYSNIRKFNMDTMSFVSSCDMSSLTDHNAFAGGFTDGRYAFCVPNQKYIATKTSLMNFAASGTSSVNLQSYTSLTLHGFWGGFTDGTYAYYVPHYYGVYRSGFTRIEIDSFTLAGTSVLDLSLTDAQLAGFKDGFTDGVYAYLCPNQNGKAVRILLSDFATVTVLNLASVDAQLTQFSTVVYDGTYAYYIPETSAQKIAIVDLENFTTTGVRVLDLSSYGNAYYFSAAKYDGRYIWLVNRTQYYVFRIDTLDLTVEKILTDEYYMGGFISEKYLFMIPNKGSGFYDLKRVSLL
jgi:hypothetical protein